METTEPVVTPAIDFTGVNLPFTVTDLLTSGNGLLSIVGTFVLLGHAFELVPKIISLIRTSFGNSRR